MLDWLLSIDGGVLLWMQEFLRGPVLDTFFGVYTKLGDSGILFLVASALMLCFRRTRKAGFVALLAIGLGFLCTNVVLKHLVGRVRPFVDVAGLVALVEEHDVNSFPSGHTCAAFAFAGAMWRALPVNWGKLLAVVAAALMGFSRLYVGVHYPSDVLAGAVIGFLSGLLAWYLWNLVEKRRAKRI